MLAKTVQKLHKTEPSDSFYWILLMDASFVMYCIDRCDIKSQICVTAVLKYESFELGEFWTAQLRRVQCSELCKSHC